MQELITTFHIDWKLLIAQIVNFGIVLFVIWKFAFKPLTKVMDERSKDIAKSLDDAKKIEENLAKSLEEKNQIIMEAKKEAQGIIQKSQEQGKKQGEEIVASAKTEVANVIAGAKEQIAEEKIKMIKDVKTEVANLVVESTKKILEKVINKDLDEKIIKESLKDK